MTTNFEKFIIEFNSLDKATRDQAMLVVSDALGECVAGKRRFGGIRYADMARFLCHYSFSISDQRRLDKKSKSTQNAVDWKRLAEEINTFVSDLPTELKGCCYSGKVSTGQVATFATFTTRKRGTRKNNGLLLTFVLFLCGLFESKILEREYLRHMLTSDERLLPGRLLNALRSYLELPGSEGEPAKPTIGITQTFEVNQNAFDDMADFVRSFVHGKDGCAHAVIYRPMRRDPKQLIKSFLAISPPERGGDDKFSFQFTHVYHPPKTGGRVRIGSGKVIPLEHGIYFVGGQRPADTSYTPGGSRIPFASLKVLAIRWVDIRTGLPIIPGLAMSTNNTGELISSRVAIRRTPAQRADKLALRPFPDGDLVANLRADAEVERAAITAVREAQDDAKILMHKQNEGQFGTHVIEEESADHDELFDELAAEIRKFANNAPLKDSDWCVPDGFIRETKKRKDSLDDKELTAALAAALKGDGGETFDKDGKPFDLWSDLRMSPIQLD